MHKIEIMIENQEKLENGTMLPIMEDFYTLQGEGFYTGTAAYFLRIGGCDVGCSFCDVKEAWNAAIHPLVAVDEIIDKLQYLPTKTIVITGGEPCKYNLNYLCKRLKEIHFQTHLETSGSHHLSGQWNWICFSPKKGVFLHDEFYAKANELKVIIESTDDFLWAEENAKKVNKNCRLYLQPEWSKCKYTYQGIVDYILAHPQWRISIQSHKYIHIP